MKEKGRPFLSVIVTVYNLENEIGDCLQSILTQSFDDFELIVVDNGSSDKSPSICRNFGEQYPEKIKLLLLPPPSAMGQAHRAGYRMARGQFCQFVDGDDLLAAGSLEKEAGLLRESGADVLIGRFQCLAAKGVPPFLDAVFHEEDLEGRSTEEILDLLAGLPGYHMMFWRYVFRREAVQDLFTYQINKKLYLNDWLPATRILFSANRFCCLEEPVYLYRRKGHGTISSLQPQSYPEAVFFTMAEFLHLMRETGRTPAQKAFIISRLEILLQLGTSLSDRMNLSQFMEAAQALELHRSTLLDLDKATQAFQSFNQFCRQYGILEGLYLYCQNLKINCLQAASRMEEKNVYLFPTGNRGFFAARIFREAGIRVAGFLDNDPGKEGMAFDGLPCMQPQKVEGWTKDQRQGSVIFLTTCYSGLEEILRNQLKGLGMAEDHIITV